MTEGASDIAVVYGSCFLSLPTSFLTGLLCQAWTSTVETQKLHGILDLYESPPPIQKTFQLQPWAQVTLLPGRGGGEPSESSPLCLIFLGRDGTEMVTLAPQQLSQWETKAKV